MMGRWYVLVIAGLLWGCHANEGSVEQVIAQATLQATAKTEALPAEYVYRADPFVLADERVPFARPRAEERVPETQEETACWQPEDQRKPMPLEQFALEQLEMKGVIGDGKQRWALVYTPTQQLVKVRRGHYLGLNYGRVTRVGTTGLELVETLPDGAGCWLTRTVSLSIVGTEPTG
ncbi:pilus assembly protein PilP [Photobacterium sp. MCCC 1A19761]|uniref:pilus assembly protein PilP n=1 Tax=Photobacterium sp. MCCC 1A19761 TaxID=3115000 RepID=UPI00307E65A6